MPKIDRQAIYERDGGLCAFCGQPVPPELLHLDHKQPRAMGGPTTPENLRVAHRRCNIAAGVDVRQERRRLGLPSLSGSQMQVRAVPFDLWRRVQMAALTMSTPLRRVTIRDVVVEALDEWLTEKGY